MKAPEISSAQKIDIDQWNRAEAYHFFRSYDDPYFHVTVPVNITGLSQIKDKRKGSFFLRYLHAGLYALNQTPALRLRFDADSVYSYDSIHAGCTVMREDETFAFILFPYDPSLENFIENSLPLIEAGRKSKGLLPLESRPDIAFFSVLPWVSFSSFKNAHRYSREDCFPKVVFGKSYELEDKRILPVALEVHHALVDGLDVGRFYESLEVRTR